MRGYYQISGGLKLTLSKRFHQCVQNDYDKLYHDLLSLIFGREMNI